MLPDDAPLQSMFHPPSKTGLVTVPAIGSGSVNSTQMVSSQPLMSVTIAQYTPADKLVRSKLFDTKAFGPCQRTVYPGTPPSMVRSILPSEPPLQEMLKPPK